MSKRALLFPGQGSQYEGMGKTLHENFKIVRETYEEACDSLSFDIKKLSFDGPSEELALTKNTQPAILTHSISIFRIFKKETEIFNDSANLMTAGHSLGEFSSLVATGAISFFDAVRLVRCRGEFMQNACAPGVGTMAAITMVKKDVLEKICEEVSTENSVVVPANYNSETQIVISGNTVAVLEASRRLKEEEGGRVFPLSVSAAFHSPLMKDASVKLFDECVKTEIKSPLFSYIPNVSGELQDGLVASDICQLLKEQMVKPVLWTETMSVISKHADLAIEMGPKKVLTGLFRKFDRKYKVMHVDSADDLKSAIKKLEGTK